MNERTAETTTTVEEGGIRVEKSFTDDAFPVPAVRYDLSSRRENAARVRLVDTIPDSFPMDRIGFHPDYESENWTAYKDHRVEFERVLEPGESVETVFGIREDDPALEGFLGRPAIEHVSVGDDVDDVLGAGDVDAVREVLSGDRETLPGMDEPVDGESTMGESTDSEPPEGESTDSEPLVGESMDSEIPEGESAQGESTGVETETPDDSADPIRDDEDHPTPTPRDIDDDTTAAVVKRGGAEDDDRKPALDTEASSPTDVVETNEEDAESDETSDVATTAPQQGVAATLAEEIRTGEVDENDLEVLRSELDIGVPRSVDVRISRLQSSMADIETYADALAEFIDEEGTAREVLDGVDARVEAIEAEVDALDDRIEAGERAHGELTTDLTAATATLEQLEDTVGSVEKSVSTLDDETDDIGDDIETLYEEVDDAAATAERAIHRVRELEDRLSDDLEDVDADLAAINEHLEDLEAFRKRLNEAFGP